MTPEDESMYYNDLLALDADVISSRYVLVCFENSIDQDLESVTDKRNYVWAVSNLIQKWFQEFPSEVFHLFNDCPEDVLSFHNKFVDYFESRKGQKIRLSHYECTIYLRWMFMIVYRANNKELLNEMYETFINLPHVKATFHLTQSTDPCFNTGDGSAEKPIIID